MSTLVMDSSQDLPQSSEPCGSCSLYPSAPSWTSSVLSPGAQEELYDGRDIHVETRLRGLAEGGDDPLRVAVARPASRGLLTFLVVTAAVSYAARGLLYRQWGMVDWSEGSFFRADVVVPAVVGVTAGTLATRSTGA